MVQLLDRLTFPGSIANSRPTVSVRVSALGTDFFATKNFNKWITEALCCLYSTLGHADATQTVQTVREEIKLQPTTRHGQPQYSNTCMN